MTAVLAVLLVCVSLLSAFFTLLVRMRPARGWTPDPNWLGRFSLRKYRRMERLLLESDYAFLSRQPGYTPELGAGLRRARHRIFRSYLRSLARDFMRLHAVARWLLAHSAQDRPELGVALMQQQLRFVGLWFYIEARLALGLGAIDVTPLVRTVEGLRSQLVPAPAITAA